MNARRDYDREPVTHETVWYSTTRWRSLCGADNPAPRSGPITCKNCLRILKARK